MLIPIKYNVRYLITRWTGTLMTALTFALVVGVFVIVMALAQGLERAFVTTGDPLNLLIMRTGVQSEMQSAVQIERYQVIRNLPGIANDEAGEPLVAPETLVIVNKPKNPDGKPSNLQIRGIHEQVKKLRPQVEIVEGRWFRPGLREVIVSKSISNRFQNFKIGDKPFLGKGTWEVVGIFEAGGTAYESEVWTDYQELMTEFNRDAYSTVVVRALDRAAVADLKRVVDEDPRLKLEASTEVEYYEKQTDSAGPLKAFGSFLSIIMAVGACFAGMNTMYGSVANRAKEIGTLRILGFTPAAILTSFLIESIFLALIGGALGCVLAIPMRYVSTGTTNFQTFSEVVFNFAVTPQLIVSGLTFAAIMGAIGGFFPAFSAARQPIILTLKRA